MKIIFNDASELQVQSVSEESGVIKIKVLKTIISQEKLKEVFSDSEKTKRITVQETGKTVGVYDNYTQLYGIMAYTAGILEPILYKVGETPEEVIKRLQEDNEALKEQTEMLTQCIIEMSEQVYQ